MTMNIRNKKKDEMVTACIYRNDYLDVHLFILIRALVEGSRVITRPGTDESKAAALVNDERNESDWYTEQQSHE